MLSISEIKISKLIQINNEPYQVLKADHHKMGRGGAVLKTKLRNLITGHILDKTWQGNDKANKAITETKQANFMYQDGKEAHFMDNQSFEQFSLPVEQINEKLKFLPAGIEVDILYFQDKPVAVNLPVKVELKVVSAPPGVKGNSAGNVTKVVELETGAQLTTPMFINKGDVIRINTNTGEYVERV
ncbi:elongation factor P [Candidatus Falkowbacteria bacterium CG_4_9_14_3_um_filter_38_19]|uniref:Elongation factor P n=2 Tax=Candidatus Falkowiibacteriota TaxID=1752728 RepID=A0A2M6WRS2_9BACT|nr:elongation factor P [Candidatus Falkowbacteria bacterium]PIT95474.1 MAG: elongation factor P [Candidatus Falkowbacteria bacterium CG10_big_fil_rev_8_21_14_0_10_38_22]PJB17093.1 MAG: elongation factor P [Candidatus Falkowbacteria bacterium CG_4_9_14_3_um_filter_38_19]